MRMLSSSKTMQTVTVKVIVFLTSKYTKVSHKQYNSAVWLFSGLTGCFINFSVQNSMQVTKGDSYSKSLLAYECDEPNTFNV